MLINRMVLNNVGMSADSLAHLLDSISMVKDFKSFIYKQGGLNSLAIDRMAPILYRPVPNHLEELAIIDIKVTPTVIEELLEAITYKSRIKKFALVRVNHSERSFEKLA